MVCANWIMARHRMKRLSDRAGNRAILAAMVVWALLVLFFEWDE
jgi:hypothetical protein